MLNELVNLPDIRAKGLQLAVQEFISRLGELAHPPAAEVQLNGITDTWPSYDSTVDEKWAEIVPREARAAARSPNIPDANSSLTVKPSFSLDCLNWIQWHWPPFTTAKPEYGETADTTNACTRQQFEKFPASEGQIFTSDRIWRRFRRTVDDPKPYDRTSRELQLIHEEFHRFLWTVNKSPVVLLLGEKNVTSFPNETTNCIAVRIPGPKLYTKKATLWLMLNEDDGIIERIILPSYHPEMVFRNLTQEHAAQMDWTWNLMAALGNLQLVNSTYFQWKCSSHSIGLGDNGRPVINIRRGGILTAFFDMMAWETATGRTIAPSDLPQDIKTWFDRQGVTWQENVSMASQALMHAVQKSVATNAANGFPNLAKGRATLAANGYQNLAKGRATQAASGFPSLQKGLATNAANRFPNLDKGSATQAANGFLNLQKGYAKEVANGFPNLKNGQKKGTQNSLVTQAAKGFPNLQKGRAVMAAKGFPNSQKAKIVNAALGHPGLQKAWASQAADGYSNLQKAHAARTAKALKKDMEFSPDTRRKRQRQRERDNASRAARRAAAEAAKA